MWATRLKDEQAHIGLNMDNILASCETASSRTRGNRCGVGLDMLDTRLYADLGLIDRRPISVLSLTLSGHISKRRRGDYFHAYIYNKGLSYTYPDEDVNSPDFQARSAKPMRC